ncbi:CDP-6-deoxy-delta-3,4-glucoseen reductase [Lysobacter xinjiangensis]|uniref:CDP-6-deoxy-delta-3,4-glucoseen reductase n=1 Tax=Cognatilysobacter xinjiangensis TaxID=546892 RepID=A0ABQ3C1Q1_9GAMM|nr:translesion DNA synthesis-associated protein ImuA [Lysobacter xinjiangensis]GGZ64580.1 CDP-6-deoxy-delta-3,4-glucoseen reductase [Lysobacter xinjiangensis]
MGEVHALDTLMRERPVWRGRSPAPVRDGVSTGHARLDAALPGQGWIAQGLNEILLPDAGLGELELVWPALARLASTNAPVVLVAPPYVPYPPAWHAAGVRLDALHVVHADPRDALWAAEQCMRSGSCGAVLCWPSTDDDRPLRRLQVAAEAGRCLGFAFRPARAALNPSPAPLRIALEASPVRQLRVLKCRGANPPPWPLAFPREA